MLNYKKLQRVIDVICQECNCEPTQTHPSTLNSETLYNQLVSKGEHFAQGELDTLLTHLRERGLISVIPAPEEDKEAIAKHGALTITGVAPGLC